MEQKIAVLMDSCGQILPLKETGVIKLFQRDSGHWIVAKGIVFGIGSAANLQEIQSRIRAMVKELDDCKIIVASKTAGITAAILEGLGCIVWEATGNTADFLDRISDEMAKAKVDSSPQSIPMPIPNDREGYYYLDLKKNLEGKEQTQITSKAILQPFFQNVVFTELTILCDHVPRWFEQELPSFNLRVEIENPGEDLLKVKVVAQERK